MATTAVAILAFQAIAFTIQATALQPVSMVRRFDRLTFRVPDGAACRAFYREMLGMETIASSPVLGYSPNGLKLAFTDNPDCTSVRQSTSSDAYWKIGIAVKNLDYAVGFLQLQGVPVSKPAQFLDIGYLCHLRDPAGLDIELLQQGFEGDEEQVDPNLHPIGGQATLAHISIRTTDLPKTKKWCEETMGLRLLSVQPVQPYGFTLHFYSWSEETLPNPDDLKAVENRPWLWARPHGLLEIQQLEKSGGELRSTGTNEAGPIELLITEGDSNLIGVDCSKELGL